MKPLRISHLACYKQDLRRNFPVNFRRAMGLDESSPQAVNGPFTALLGRMGLESPTPPRIRGPSTFGSPRRIGYDDPTWPHGDDRELGAATSTTPSSEDEQQRADSFGRRQDQVGEMRALSASPPPTRPREGNRPSWVRSGRTSTWGEGCRRVTKAAQRSTLNLEG